MLKPQDIMIGDYLLADGKVIQVAAIHQKKVGYHNVPNKLTWVRLDRLDYIKITPETLMAFGFKKTASSGYLFNEAWMLRAENLTREEGSPFRLSWFVEGDDEDNEIIYRVICCGHGLTAIIPHDSISEMQHFFYEHTGGNVMPIKYKPEELE